MAAFDPQRVGMLLALGSALVAMGLFVNKWVLEASLVADGVIESRWALFSIGFLQIAHVGAGIRTLYLTARPPALDPARLLRRERPWLGGVLVAWVLVAWAVSAEPSGSFRALFGSYEPRRFAASFSLTLVAALVYYVSGDLRSWKSRAARAALSIASIAFVIAVLELPAGLGWVDYRTLFVPHGVGFEGPHNRLLSEEGFFHRPARDRVSEARPGDAAITMGARTGRVYPADYEYDEHGFRNRTGLTSPEVVFVGDSFVEGYRVTQAHTLTERFSRWSGLETVALGQADFSPYHELSALRSHIARLDPRIVVWFVYEGNDLPPADLSYDRFLENFRTAAAADQEFGRRSFLINLWSLAARWSTAMARRWSASELARERAGHFIGTEPGPDTIMYFRYPPAVEFERELPHLLATLRDGKALCDEHAARLLVAHIPVKFEVYREQVELPEGSKLATWGRSRLAHRLADWSDRNGVAFVDLAPALRRAASHDRPVYYLDDAHWSPEGHAVAADEIGRRLAELGWLAEPASR